MKKCENDGRKEREEGKKERKERKEGVLNGISFHLARCTTGYEMRERSPIEIQPLRKTKRQAVSLAILFYILYVL